MMRRSLLAGVALACLTATLAVYAQEPTKGGQNPGTKDKDGKPVLDNKAIAEKQKELAEKYSAFEKNLLTLQQRLELSSDPKDRARAAQLKKVLETGSDRDINRKFAMMVQVLSTQKLDTTTDAGRVAAQAAALAKDLKELLDLLKSADGVNSRKEERLALEKFVKELEKVIRDEKLVRNQIRTNPDDKAVGDNQADNTNNTQGLVNKLGKPGEGGEAKNNKGTAKEGGKGDKGDTKKNEGQAGESGKGKDAGQGDGKKGESKPGNKGAESGKDGKGEVKNDKGGEGAKAGQGKDGKGEGSPQAGKDKKEGEGESGKGKEPGKEGGQAGAKPGEKNEPGGSKKSDGGEASKAGGSKPGEGSKSQPSASKPGEGSKADKAGESKPGSDSKSQGGSKSSGQQSGDPQAGGSKSDNAPPGKDNPKDDIANTKKKIQEAIEHMKQVEDEIAKGNRPAADPEAEKAITKLEDAKKKLEDLIRQLREEELERVLAALINRCQKMLQMQIDVLGGTLKVQTQIDAHPTKKAEREDIQNSLILSDDERKIVVEATKAIEMLETEGSAVAFPEVFQQIREDMKHVARRLEKTDVGDVTVTIEQDIIETLREMIKALEKAKKDLDDKKNPPKPSDAPPPPPQDQKLLDKIAELKMLKAMQLRVNSRTELYSKRYDGEQAITDDIRTELRELAGRQERIYDVANKLAKGDNQ